MSEQQWYECLKIIASEHGESVADRAAWVEDYHLGKSPHESFFDEYPEHE